MNQFKVEQEQARLKNLTVQTEQRAQEAAQLERKVEIIQQQQIDLDEIDHIEAKPIRMTSKVKLDRTEYEHLSTAAKKFVTYKERETQLQKMLDAAYELIDKLKNTIAALTKELAEYKSVHNRMNTAGLKQENEKLRSKIRTYETVIDRNNLWHLFSKVSNKSRDRNHSQ